jgi:hypothetical protein
MSDDWRRDPEIDQQVFRALQRAQQDTVNAEMADKLREMQQAVNRQIDEGTKANPFARANLRPRPPGRQPWQVNPVPPASLTEGFPVVPLMPYVRNPAALDQEWAEARNQVVSEVPDGVAAREEARMLLRDALNAGVSSGLFTEDRALAIIALTGINNQPFPPQAALENIRLALEEAERAGAISVNQMAQAIGVLKLRAPETPPAGARVEQYEDILYEALTLRPCHLEEHLEWHLAQTICAAHRVRLSDTLLDLLGLAPRMLPRAAHQDARGQILDCCQDTATQRWLLTGLTQSD